LRDAFANSNRLHTKGLKYRSASYQTLWRSNYRLSEYHATFNRKYHTWRVWDFGLHHCQDCVVTILFKIKRSRGRPLFNDLLRLLYPAYAGADPGGGGRSPPLKPTKVTLFTMILYNSETNIVRDIRPFLPSNGLSRSVKYTSSLLQWWNGNGTCLPNITEIAPPLNFLAGSAPGRMWYCCNRIAVFDKMTIYRRSQSTLRQIATHTIPLVPVQDAKTKLLSEGPSCCCD